jgi:hypothetical protein
MKGFLKITVIFLSPLLLILLLYITLDPFKVIRKYDVYLSDYVMIHRGVISTKVYLKNRQSEHFNSFIFGSSRSCAHTSKEWGKYLSKSSKPYSYGSWNENIQGIYGKIKLIDSFKDSINNAFIVIDDKTFSAETKSYIKMDHYLISGESKLNFHFFYFTKYFDIRMLMASVDYPLFHKRRNYMYDFQGMKPGDLDPVNNDWYRDIVREPDSIYYKGIMGRFYKRPAEQNYMPERIMPDDLKMLNEIKEIFKKHNTRYTIVMAPLYDQLKMNPKDFSRLADIFGKENIYDYSGINDITNNYTNYTSGVLHYRYEVGDRIFKEIYSGRK